VKAPNVKKVPSALKWLAEKRARVAGHLQANKGTLELLCGHVDVLERELRAAVALKAKTEENVQKLTEALAALDSTVVIYDESIQPADIGIINGWQGRYGKRGALREYLLEVLAQRSPDHVSSPELAFLAINEFGLVFAHPDDRKRWYQNSLKNALKDSEKLGKVERSADLLNLGNDARGWRLKRETQPTLAGLHNPRTSC